MCILGLYHILLSRTVIRRVNYLQVTVPRDYRGWLPLPGSELQQEVSFRAQAHNFPYPATASSWTERLSLVLVCGILRYDQDWLQLFYWGPR